MRALVLESFDSGARVADVPVPEIGPGEFLVRVAAASINAFDWKIATGMLTNNFHFDFPVTIGRDFAGRIEAAGDDAAGFAVGDEVYGYLSSTELHHGSLAEYLPTGNACMAPRPAEVDVASAAALPLSGMTARRCVEQLGLAPGKSVLIVGATGGVGSFAVQLAAVAGASVVATGLPEDAAYLHGLGAGTVVDHREDVEAAVRADFPGGVNAVIDLVNRGDDFMRSARLVAPGGAAVSTHRQADPERLAEFDVTAVNVGGTPDQALLAELGRLVATGDITAPISGMFPLEQAAEGLAHIRNEHVRGKYVITIADSI
jgi:NADPH:quinone reductase